MKYQIINTLLGLLIVCIQLHSFNASEETSIKSGINILKVLNLI